MSEAAESEAFGAMGPLLRGLRSIGLGDALQRPTRQGSPRETTTLARRGGDRGARPGLGLAVLACGAGSGSTISLTAADAGTTVQAKVGDPITVTLEANPTTGYDWHLAAGSRRGRRLVREADVRAGRCRERARRRGRPGRDRVQGRRGRDDDDLARLHAGGERRGRRHVRGRDRRSSRGRATLGDRPCSAFDRRAVPRGPCRRPSARRRARTRGVP